MKHILNRVLLLTVLLWGSSCEKDLINGTVGNPEQLLAGRISGTWAKPVQIITPTEVPAEVFGDMRLVFTMDESGNPKAFLGKDCPIVFSATESTWSVSGTEEQAKITLSGTTPVDELDVKVNANSMTLSFYMGWENTETGETGKGDFQVTLSRQ
ncbi:hypothetical protein [Sphingobacterium pedocola]|uniref:Lipocalin-like domain-containing protein n=1 Tax=Sphingobacterium pedocola TaxID=2082722 RepID=A0ABR9TC57_9SPHI|nr:hypothetical protein [Sphingobacterium pedocola]MBE8722622.1 hypothetical protein [Sphingobacterium pedocola]